MPEELKTRKDEAAEGIETVRHRSPNFPSLSLNEALDKGKQLYQKYQSRSVPLSLLAETWHYSQKSSGFQKAVAALGYYDLIEIDGRGEKRRARVSKTGEHILENAPDAATLLQEAALKPRLFREIWDKYSGTIPSDDLLAEDLKWGDTAKFNKDTIDTFISKFRKTVVFAKLDQGDIIEAESNGHDVQRPSAKASSLAEPSGSTEYSRASDGKPKMTITNVYDLPNARLSLKLEQLDEDMPLDSGDVETAEIYWGAFKRVIEARLRSIKKLTEQQEDRVSENG